MADLLERLPENFEMITMQLRAKPLLAGEAGPFVVVALQVRYYRTENRYWCWVGRWTANRIELRLVKRFRRSFLEKT